MALITKFCFSCSVRLGSLIIAVLTLIQASIFLGVILWGTDSLQSVSELVNRFRKEIDPSFSFYWFYQEVADNPKIFISVMCVLFTCLICSSILLLYGCIQCKALPMYPFAIFYFLYIICLFVALLLLILQVKVRGYGLGDLILYSNMGGFVLLFYLYTWVCVVSLIQIITELRNRLKIKVTILDRLQIAQKLKNKTKK